MNKIVVLSEGRIVEVDNHENLMFLEGHYHALITKQVLVEEDENIEETDESKPCRRYSSRDFKEMSLQTNPAKITEGEESNTEVIKKILVLNGPENFMIITGGFLAVLTGAVPPAYTVVFGNVFGVRNRSINQRFSNTPYSDSKELERRRSNKRILSLFFASPNTRNLNCIVDVLEGQFDCFTKSSCNCFLLCRLFLLFQTLLFGVVGEKLTKRLRSFLFASMLYQEVGWYDRSENETGALCSKLSSDAAWVQRVRIVPGFFWLRLLHHVI